MPSGWSDTEEKAILEWYFRGGGHTPPPNVWIALLTGQALDDGSNIGAIEASYTNYQRIQVPSSAAGWDLAVAGDPTTIANAAEITFDQSAGGGDDLVTHWAAMSLVSAGTMLFHGNLIASLDITIGVQPQFAAGNLVAKLGSVGES